ncbi:MAG: porphobilinogen synthase [Alphaproteobacteria bacterium]|nr:porphobilinogen synthase [Alphaproteobacteria bacterium]
MFDQPRRPRRLRSSATLRASVREHVLFREDLIMPVFVDPNPATRREIPSMPGIFNLGFENLPAEIDRILENGIDKVILFGVPVQKDAVGSDTWHDHGIIQSATRMLKERWPELFVITDVCFCEYTTHGHCGVLGDDGRLLNDPTLANLQKQAVSHADAGADMVAPSGMIDGMIGAMRTALDEHGHTDTTIMSYAVKYASAFYGPFRDAVDSAPQSGDRKTYQMDPANAREALIEAELDFEQGADILMVKPALSYLDIIRTVRDRFDVPIAAYNVSGEYAMVKAAAANGWIDGDAVAKEMLLSMKRAGTDLILTYFARDLAPSLPSKR